MTSGSVTADALDSNDNAKHEYYLTDTLGLMLKAGHKVVAITAVKPGDVLSINSRHDLAAVGNVMKHRILNRLMDSGVTVVDPDNTYIDARAKIITLQADDRARDEAGQARSKEKARG